MDTLKDVVQIDIIYGALKNLPQRNDDVRKISTTSFIQRQWIDVMAQN